MDLNTETKIASTGLFPFLIKYNTVFIFIALVVLSALISDVFFTSINLSNLLKQVSGIGIISIGMLLVILTGGIDLSVGSLLALLAVLFAIFVNTLVLPAAILLTILIGFVIGSAFMTQFGNGSFLGIPNIAYIFFVVAILAQIMLSYNVFGRLLIAIGSNEDAARLSGVKVNRYKFLVYAISGALVGVAAIVAASRTNLGSPNLGLGLELDAIAAVVIGGASLNGGKGSAINTLMGVLILGLIGNILNLLNVPSYPQQVIKGVIIILAVLLQRFENRA